MRPVCIDVVYRLLDTVNDAHGHDVGDEVLIEVASRLKKALRRYDKVGRYGGDEFLVVLPNCDMKNAIRISERLRRVVCGEKIETEAGSLSVSISAGCASTENNTSPTIENLVKISDNAMYHAKNMGRNCVVAS